MKLFNGDYVDQEKEKIVEALKYLKLNSSKTIAMKKVHATAMRKARELVMSRRK